MSAKKEYPEPRTLAELDEADPLSPEENARILAAIAEDPDDFLLTDEHMKTAANAAEMYPDGVHNPPRPTPEYIERCRRHDPELAKHLEQLVRDAEERRRRAAAGYGGKTAAAE